MTNRTSFSSQWVLAKVNQVSGDITGQNMEQNSHKDALHDGSSFVMTFFEILEK